MSLLAHLPKPLKASAPIQSEVLAPNSTVLAAFGAAVEAPPYLRRKEFVPRRPTDFGDGGAFPEIHVAQYPCDMGKPGETRSTSKTLAVTIGADGTVNYDAILKQGTGGGAGKGPGGSGGVNRTIHSDHKALMPKVERMKHENMQKPDEEEIAKSAKETAEALALVVQGKIATTNPATLPNQPGGPTYIKYTPQQQGAQYNSGAGQRIIKMQDMPIDPLEPPKFRHTKVPRGAGSPPVPVMHSPPRPLTVQDQANWKIPPCISNWKNPKGYTIPLDKRLAADGRGLQTTVINDKFASLSEALFTAEAKAREAIGLRAAMQKELLMKEKARKEGELRELAMKARMERGGGPAGGGLAARIDPGADAGMANGRDSEVNTLYILPADAGMANGRFLISDFGGRGAVDGVLERRRERERERRLESKDAHGTKKSKITRDRDRDVGEKVALGMANTGAGGEVMYDQRLFNQDHGMAAGFGGEDSYNVYDKALFVDRTAAGGLHRQYRCWQIAQDQGMAAGFGGTDSYNVYDKALFVDRTAAGGLHRWVSSYRTATEI
eukprot:gene5031-34818_t